MRTIFAIFSMLIVLGAPNVFAAGSLERALMKLSPEERAHQACVVKGLETIRRDKRLAKADRLQPDTFKRANFADNVVIAKGAAVRNSQHWFELSFDCKVSDDQMKAVAFTYQLGKEIPPDTWADVGLWR
jgi:hypothetical protein